MNRNLNLFLIGISLLILISCSSNTDTITTVEDPNIDGVWEMTNLYTYDDGDTTEVDLMGHRQIKIYTDGYVMWSRTVPRDSTQWYGWGGYAVEDGMLKEWIEYGSHAFMPHIDPMIPFEHRIKKSGNTYVQTRYDSVGNPEVSEHYILISEMREEDDENTDTSLEGVWEMTKLENTNSGDLGEADRTGYRQIKMYRDGFVMWSQQVPPDATEWFGFGKYSSTGGLLTEWMEFGSHSFMPFIGDEPFIQDLQYGENTYVQVMKDSTDNPTAIEYYKKLKGEKADPAE